MNVLRQASPLEPGCCSVVLTCYNEGPYIEAAVRSVLDQTRADLVDRIVIADDGSEPLTIAALRTVAKLDDRIEVIYGAGGLGLSANRNVAAARCGAEFLAILDGDDIWSADKLERQLPAIAADPACGLVYSDYSIFPDDNLSAARRAGVLDITAQRGGPGGDLTRTYFLNDPPIIPSTIIVRRALYERAGSFDVGVRVFEDTDFYVRMAELCSFALVDRPLLYKRQRGSSITGGRSDLMAHHAFVAFRAAVIRPDLLPLVPRRLAERARKLGNQRYLIGDRTGAVRHLRLAVRLDAWNLRAWVSLTAAGLLAGMVELLLGRWLARRRAAMLVDTVVRAAPRTVAPSCTILTCEFPPFPGGIGSYAGEIDRELRRRGVRVTTIAPRYPGLPMVSDAERTHRLFGHHRISAAALVRALRILRQQPRTSIVLAADIRSVLLVAAWALVARRPYRVMVHGSEAIKFVRRPLLGGLVRLAYRRAERVLANSQATLDIFEQSFGPMRQAQVTYLGVGESWGETPPDRFSHPALRALPPDAAIFATVGRVEQRKGQEEAVRVLAAAQAKLPRERFTYVVAGHVDDPAYADDICAAAEQAGLPVILTGRLPEGDLRLLYRRATAHLLCAQPLPTKIEGFGLVLLEAAAQGCPSIATRVGGIGEVLGEGNPLLYEPGDVVGMAAAAAALRADPGYRRAAADLMHDRVALFSWHECANRTFPEFAVPVPQAERPPAFVEQG